MASSASIDPMVMLFLFKVVRIGTSYISVTITSNFMAQVYMDKVLINQENPQHLTNFIMMFCVIDAIITTLLLGLFYLTTSMMSESSEDKPSDFMSTYMPIIQDYVCFLLVVGATGYIIANTMYNKKYFMYKDDGLRAIRALKEILFSICIVNGLIPYNMILKSISKQN